MSSVFRDEPTFIQYQSDELEGEMPGRSIDGADITPMEFANIRCRNFSPLSIEKTLRLIDPQRSRFFLFVRHPASFFRSAASYHLRGTEKWATRRRYSYLDNKTLTQALKDADNLETRLMLTMKHFGLMWSLPDRWISCYRFLVEMGIHLTIIRIEELFNEGEESYFNSLATQLSHDGFEMSAQRLMASSPRFMQKLPSHSTGEFKKKPLDDYTGKALEMYNQWFLPHQEFFYGESPLAGRA